MERPGKRVKVEAAEDDSDSLQALQTQIAAMEAMVAQLEQRELAQAIPTA
jgi:hypothetical protein